MIKNDEHSIIEIQKYMCFINVSIVTFIITKSSKYEQPLYNFFKNMNFAFSPYYFWSKTNQEIEFF